jgi:hypothetical protein
MLNQKRNRTIVFTLCLLALVIALALTLSNRSDFFGDGMHVVLFDEDYSDSFIGWLIAIPVLIVTGVFTAVVLAGTGVVVAVALAVAAVATLLALFLALVVSILPLAVFVAIPILAVVGLVKLLQK